VPLSEPAEIRITVRRPDVIDEVFDGEAVIVNLRTGRYFAFDAAATQVWQAVVAGTSWPALADDIAAAAGATPAGVQPVVARFLGELLTHELIAADGALPDAPAPDDAGDAAVPVPSLQVFSDMEDLLLLDPIHDIDLDGTGWPQAPSPASA
jgi:hypothetical protein